MPPSNDWSRRGPRTSIRTAILVAVVGTLTLIVLVVGLDRAGATTTARTPIVTKTEVDPTTKAAAQNELTVPKAAVLGVVEGVTEFLPISSTGHLLVTERLLDIGKVASTKDVADAYTVAIQAGAILAVLLLYWRRLWSMVEGLIGRSESGRRVLIAVVVAAIPIAVVGLALEKKIKERLLEPGPVIIAWLIGGALLLVYARRWDASREGIELDDINIKQAVIIGCAQVISLWPGTSRALVTIVAGLAVGLTLSAAVEFSFVLGFVTLGAATAYELVKDGPAVLEAYGAGPPVVGLVFAFASAAIAIKWMVSYLQRHSIAIFGYYRIAVAALAAVLLFAGVL